MTNTTTMAINDFCPRGFVIPDDIGRSTNIFINETISLCAVSCLHPPTFTEQQQSLVDAMNKTGVVLTSGFALMVVFIWRCDPVKRKQTFIVVNGLVMGIGFFFMILCTIPGSARLCRDNTSTVRGGPISFCVVEGALYTFILLFTVLCYSCQSFEVFRRVVLGLKSPPNMRNYMLGMLGLPLALVVSAFATGSLGHLRDYPMCGMVDRSGPVFVGMMSLILVCTGCGLIFTSAVIIKLVWLIRQPEGISVTSGAYLTVSTTIYMVFSTGYFWSLLVIDRASFEFLKSRNERVLEWGSCALENYDGAKTASYTSVCGVQPKLLLPFGTICFLFLWSRAGFGVFFFLLNMEGFYGIIRKILHYTKIIPFHYEEYEEQYIDSSSSVDVVIAASNLSNAAGLRYERGIVSVEVPKVSQPVTITPPRSAPVSYTHATDVPLQEQMGVWVDRMGKH